MSHNSRLRRPYATAAGLGLAALVLALSTTACSTADAICSDGEYPVIAVGGPGSACFPDGEEPSEGYVRYPEGKVPEHVGDTWDTYWESRTVDKDGRTVGLPDGE
ncbi:SCO0607 family lipoprotein [Streptomyces nitrosporeus]|uniref:Lipoprotein n=1 Tax=Streptomyces nitrosporeus TaxID=28894 RepID=A0A5J6F9G8_9ACTN|nr:hypothetical protein [Streptomyces nitrosporeus]QEU72357.1 hypothetical protein CP967_10470 [Streptomyces nitrosporeus]GGY78566.1 hypothetical protein GCM10010327_06050 [Streptomyces nitrosporeus]